MKNLLLISVILLSSLKAQNIGEWKIFSDMKDVQAITKTNDGIWAATTGGAFKYNFLDESIITLTKAEKLNSQILTAINVDNDGKIWFGTFEGYIISYNPIEQSVKNILDIYKSGKSQKRINNIYTKSDTIIVSTDFGLVLINSRNYFLYDTFLKLGDFPSELKIKSAIKTSLIYACTVNGIAIQKPGTINLSAPESWLTFKLYSDIPASSINKIVEWNNKILIATDNGIFLFENNKWNSFLLQENNVNDIYANGNNLFIITNNSLYQYSDNELKIIYEDFSSTFTSVIYGNSKIYIGSNKGLIEINGNTIKEISPEGPPKNLFINLAVDGNSNLWVATGKDGAGIGFMKFDGEKWTLFNKQNYPQLPSNDYFNVYAGFDNTIYLANWGNGITIFKDGNIEVYKKDNSPLIGISKDTNFIAIPDIKQDSKGNVWIANSETISRKLLSVFTKEKKWYSYSFINPTLTENDVIFKLVIDQYDTKWFLLLKGQLGLYYFNENGTFENLNDDKYGYLGTNNGLISEVVTALAVDKRGQLWIGTNKGMNFIPEPSNPRISDITIPSLRNQSITCIAVDALDLKWVGTKNGIFVLSSDGLQLLERYTSSNSPLPDDDIRSIAIDEIKGRVYIGTDYGLVMIQTSSIKPVDSFNELFVYPNPFTLEGKNNYVTIDGLIRNSLIKIIDINGNLIKSIKTPGGKIALWDGTDANGNLVGSGIYIIIAYDEEANNVATGKIAVIRK
ncbi:two-component regulator propeller domain-containing protein [Rosettibacter firmus]|uniref:type IX secretion system anionic LPS delivery protein PorZ n=1 Tax=Rosettibacter firmus TaxID=3111522 RepID=UPI00336C0EA1